MAWTDITKPAVGDPTKKQAFADAVIDDLTHLKVGFDTLMGLAGVRNGSFENDSDSDGIPDNWARTLYTGGSFALDTTTPAHGDTAIKFTRALGVGNGGGYIQTEDYFEVSPQRVVFAQWQHKVSAAGLKDRVEFYWFKADKTASTTPSTTIHESTANPTAWRHQMGGSLPPSDARFAKIRITGGFTDTNVAGDSYWDDVRVLTDLPAFSGRRRTFTASGTFRPPTGTNLVLAIVVGGGGGGAGGTSGTIGGGGGGGAAVAIQLVPVVAGSDYTVTIGAGGAGGASGADGADGGATTFGGITAAGGIKGLLAGQAGGAGGATTTDVYGFAGGTGGNGSGGDGGRGGDSDGRGQDFGGTADNGTAPGSGGSGGLGTGGGGNSGEAGENGQVVILY